MVWSLQREGHLLGLSWGVMCREDAEQSPGYEGIAQCREYKHRFFSKGMNVSLWSHEAARRRQQRLFPFPYCRHSSSSPSLASLFFNCYILFSLPVSLCSVPGTRLWAVALHNLRQPSASGRLTVTQMCHMKEAVPMTVGNAFAYFLKKKKPFVAPSWEQSLHRARSGWMDRILVAVLWCFPNGAWVIKMRVGSYNTGMTEDTPLQGQSPWFGQ